MTGAMFRVEFGAAAAQTIADQVPNDTVFRAIEMLRSIGDTAAAMELPARERLDLTLTVDDFVFHYTLDVACRLIRIFSVLPALNETG